MAKTATLRSSLLRLHVQRARTGTRWEVSCGNPEPLLTDVEWAEAEAFAQRIADRWRSHFAAWM